MGNICFFGVLMFEFSVKTRYGMTALLELAQRFSAGSVQAREIAERHSIPLKFLEQVLSQLKGGGFIRSFRGSQGGYALARTPQQIRLLDVLACLEGPISLGQDESDPLRLFWAQVGVEISRLLDRTLKDLLLDQQRAEKVVLYTI